mgnify:CR=1 FL=1
MDNNKYIIFEEAYSSEPKIVSNDGNVLVFVATLQEFDKPNRNGRVYPLEVGKEMIQNEIIQERLRTRTLYVEDQHPLDRNEVRQMRLEPSNSVGIITDMWFEGNILKGKIETLASQKGRDYRDMILYNKINPAFSLRAKGSVKKDPMTGLLYVQKPVIMVGYDTVVTPSHVISWMDSIIGMENRSLNNDRLFSSIQTMREDIVLMESLETIYNNGLLTPVEAIVKDVRPYSGRRLKKLDEMYIHRDGDKLKEVTKEYFLVESVDGTQTKMMAEEFIVKDIRAKILKEAGIGSIFVKKESVKGNIPKAILYNLISDGKESSKYIPKNPERKKVYDEILSAVKSDANIQKQVAEFKKLKAQDKSTKGPQKKIKELLKYIIDSYKKKLYFS